MSFPVFAQFIITRNRPEVLVETIKEIFRQTVSPKKILILDNSENYDTKNIIERLNDDRIEYLHIGYNAGPAGAGYIGVEKLFEQGYEWVLWGDDDDPPIFEDVVEKLFQITEQVPKNSLGLVGAVGVNFDTKTAKIERIPDSQLCGLLEVDAIAGNMIPLIHRNVYENNALPDKSLFFGFEELDFCLSVKRAGLKIYVSGEEMVRHRKHFGRIGLKEKKYTRKNLESLWREYYSTRNLIHILLRKEKQYIGTAVLIFRVVLKMFYGFRYGFTYGKKNFIFLGKGVIHGLFKKMGLTITPIPKK